MNLRWRAFVLISIVLILFLIPSLFWGNLYIVGGDDARLYYLYPLEYLKNFSFNVMSGNTLGGNLGYMPVSHSAPIIAVLLLLKNLLPFANTQLVAYGILFSLGFLFFYLFLQELILKKTQFNFWTSIVASLSYLLSQYIGKTYFQNQFISIFLLMVLPGSLFLFVSGLKRRNTARVVASSLFYSVFGASVYGFPWLLPVCITLIPFLIYLAVLYGKLFWKMIFVFFGVSLLCNVYWIIHYIIPVIYGAGDTSYAATLISKSFIQENNNIIASLVYLNNPVHQIIQFLRTSWQDRQGATIVQTIGTVYLFIIIVAGTQLRKVGRKIRVLYLTASGGLLLAMMFETPNFGLWNMQLFQFLNSHTPFFVIFRNMYDKFALAMAFTYALALWISLMVLDEAKIKRTYMYVLLFVVVLVTVVRSFPYMHPDYREMGYSTRISGLNQDYMDMTRYVQSMNTTSRFVWYPMTFGDYVYISDQMFPNHYYVGISPLQIFSRASDLAGFYGLQTPGDPQLNWTVLALLQQKKFTDVGNIFKQQNVGFVIVNNEKIPQGVPFVLEQFDFVKSQNEIYKNTILGEKIRDFGKRYSLYRINPEFSSPTVYLTDSEIPFHKNPDGVYDIGPYNVSQRTNLILMEPYSRLWTLERLDGGRHSSVEGVNTLAVGYGNSWFLDPERLGTPIVHIRAEFWPNKLIVPSIIFSIVSALAAGVYCVARWL